MIIKYNGEKVKNRPPYKKAYTFDDVLLVPQKSSILPRDVSLHEKYSNVTFHERCEYFFLPATIIF